jgi:hypothetical protein
VRGFGGDGARRRSQISYSASKEASVTLRAFKAFNLNAIYGGLTHAYAVMEIVAQTLRDLFYLY